MTINPLFRRFRYVLVISWLLSWVVAGFFDKTLTANEIEPKADSLVREVLSESIPTAFPASNLEAEDYQLEWVGKSPEGVTAKLEKGSLQWVRVRDVLRVPRARVWVRVKGAVSGFVSSGGYDVHLMSTKAGLVAAVPVALVSGSENKENLIALTLTGRSGEKTQSTLRIRYRPRAEQAAEKIQIDASCSKYGVEVLKESLGANERAYIGCRRIVTQGTSRRVNYLDFLVFWEGPQAIQMDGVPGDSAAASTWSTRKQSQPGRLVLQSGESSISLSYRLSPDFKAGMLGLGVGPYSYHFEAGNELTDQLSPALMLYGSYVITDTSRFILFDATTVNARIYTDFGVYFSTESTKALDRRVSVNLMLGGHVVGFKSAGQYQLIPGFPQGFELIYQDAIQVGKNLSFGAFIYPNISGKAYYNTWLRWGGRAFGELNYISFRENVNGVGVYSRSFGLTFGLPLFQVF